MQALFFDCDGVLADTERDGHRLAFNQAFAQAGLAAEWSVERYADLLRTTGGKERMARDFDETGWPADVPIADRDALIAGLHQSKTRLFADIVEGGRMPLRPGVARLIDEALGAGMKVAVCSTSNEMSVRAILRQLGPERVPLIAVFTGDIVAKKKPDPAIYRLAAETLGLDPAQCVVIEDSNNGLRAALAAGMVCIVTTSSFTGDEDFTGAARVVTDLGDDPRIQVSLADCRACADAAVGDRVQEPPD